MSRTKTMALGLLTLSLMACGDKTPTANAPTETLTGTAGTGTTICGTENVALNKPATASSTENVATTPDLAVDDNGATRWSSSYGDINSTSAINDNQWLQVDLGSIQTVCGAAIYWETAYGQSYDLEVSSDQQNWTSIFHTDAGMPGVQGLSPIKAVAGRYVRVKGIKRGTGYGYSIRELGLYLGSAVIPPVTPPVMPPVTPPVTPPAGLKVGDTVSLQVATPGFTNRYLRHLVNDTFTEGVTAASDAGLKGDASWKVVAGLSDPACVSFQSVNSAGKYLRHALSRLRIDADPANADTALFKSDATFCAKAGLDGGSTVSLASKNVPGSYVRHRNAEVWLDVLDAGNTLYKQDASWTVAAAWSGGSVTPPVTPPPVVPPVTPPPVVPPVTPPVTLPVPPETVQDRVVDRDALVTRVYYDDDIAVYFGTGMDKSVNWMNGYLRDAWRYTKATYGTFGPDPRLNIVAHADKKYNFATVNSYFDSGFGYRSTLDLGGVWDWANPQPINYEVMTHEMAHIVEGSSKNTHESPSFEVWGDSKWAEIFIYDVYKALGKTQWADDWYNRMISNQGGGNYPNAYWFRDWFYPIYNDNGGAKVLNNYFNTLSQCFPKRNIQGGQGGVEYDRRMNMGEFVHFWSGAAGKNLKDQATKAFGWTSQLDSEFKKAQSDFSCAVYPK